jgi:AraC-like DNA-binding protein
MKDSLIFHIVCEGSAWVTFKNGERYGLETGDFTLLPQGRGHAIVDDPDTPSIHLFDYERPLLSPRYEFLEVDGGGAKTSLICGVASVKDPATQRMIGLLPKCIQMKSTNPGNEWLLGSVQMMMQEARSLGPGGDAVITRVSDILVVQAIRHWMRTDPHAQTGWLGALQDPQVGHALTLIHREPTKPWTVDSLAESVGVSRSGLAARFTDLVGQPPMTYLRQWRFEVARSWLRESDHTLAEIAEALGYESEASFSRAFKKATGQTPGNARNGIFMGRIVARTPDPSGNEPFSCLGRFFKVWVARFLTSNSFNHSIAMNLLALVWRIFLFCLPVTVLPGQARWFFEELAISGDGGNEVCMEVDDVGRAHLLHYEKTRAVVEYVVRDWPVLTRGTIVHDLDQMPTAPSRKGRMLEVGTGPSGAVFLVYTTCAADFGAECDYPSLRYRVMAPDGTPGEEVPLFYEIPEAMDLAVDAAGNVFLLYTEPLLKLEIYRITDGAMQESEFVNPPPGYAYSPQNEVCISLDVGPDGNLHAVLEYGEQAFHGNRDASGNWIWQAIPTTAAVASDFDLVAGADGSPRLAYRTGEALDRVVFAEWVNGSLQETEVFSAPNAGFDLALGHGDEPHLAILEPGAAEGRTWHHVWRDSGGAWRTEAILVDRSLEEEPAERAPKLDLEFDVEGQLLLALDTGPPFNNLLLGRKVAGPWTTETVDQGASAVFEYPSLMPGGRSEVAYRYKGSATADEAELRLAAYDAITDRRKIETVLSGDSNTGLHPDLAENPSGQSVISSYSIADNRYRFSRSGNVPGAWHTALIESPEVNDAGIDNGRGSFIFGRLGFPELEVVYEDGSGGIRLARPDDSGEWRIHPHNPLPAGQSYRFHGAVGRKEAPEDEIYVLYGRGNLSLRMAIWNGEQWAVDEEIRFIPESGGNSIAVADLPGNFIDTATLVWDHASHVPVVVCSKSVTPTRSPIYIIRREGADFTTSLWKISQLAEPDYGVSELQAHFGVSKQIVAYGGFLRPLEVLIREIGKTAWTRDPVPGATLAGFGLSLSAAEDRLWLAYPQRDPLTGEASLQLAYRSLQGSVDRLDGPQDYGAAPVVGYNLPSPCDFRPDVRSAGLRGRGALPSVRAGHEAGAPLGTERELDLLRALRDRLIETERGRTWVDRYYQHNDEAARLGIENPYLLFRLYQVMKNLEPGLRELVADEEEKVEIGAATVQMADEVLDELRGLGSPQLQNTIDSLRSEVGPLGDLAGKGLMEVAKDVGVVRPSRVELEGVGIVDGRIAIRARTDEGYEYVLRRRSLLEGGVWEDVPSFDLEEKESGIFEWTDETPLEEAPFFYYLEAVPAEPAPTQ